MRIILFINSLHEGGGTERVTTVLANHWSLCGHEVFIVTLQKIQSVFFPLRKEVIFFNLNSSFVNIYYSHLNNIFKLRKLIQILKPNVFIDVATALSLISIPALFGLRIKHIAWEHFNASINWNFITTPLARFLCSKFCFRVVTLTTSDKVNYEKKYLARNVVVIPNPITLSPYIDLSALDKSKSLIKKSLNLSNDKKFALAIGRLTKQKGFDLLIESWSIARKNLHSWSLLIVGDGPELSFLEQLRNKLQLNDEVFFVSSTDKISNYYLACDLMICSSRFEGLPLVLIEAKAFSLPIVSFDCQTGPRDIIRDQIDGILVEALNVDELAAGIVMLTSNNNLRIAMGKMGNKDLSRFELQKINDMWQSLFFEK